MRTMSKGAMNRWSTRSARLGVLQRCTKEAGPQLVMSTLRWRRPGRSTRTPDRECKHDGALGCQRCLGSARRPRVLFLVPLAGYALSHHVDRRATVLLHCIAPPQMGGSRMLHTGWFKPAPAFLSCDVEQQLVQCDRTTECYSDSAGCTHTAMTTD